jgi:hypothetical protein
MFFSKKGRSYCSLSIRTYVSSCSVTSHQSQHESAFMPACRHSPWVLPAAVAESIEPSQVKLSRACRTAVFLREDRCFSWMVAAKILYGAYTIVRKSTSRACLICCRYDDDDDDDDDPCQKQLMSVSSLVS